MICVSLQILRADIRSWQLYLFKSVHACFLFLFLFSFFLSFFSSDFSTGKFGACFIPGLCKQSDLTLYAARPGLRLWKADVHGTVQATFILKDVFAGGVTPFELYPRLEPSDGGSCSFPEKHLGLVSCFFQEGWVLSWNEYSIYLLDTVNQVCGRTAPAVGHRARGGCRSIGVQPLGSWKEDRSSINWCLLVFFFSFETIKKIKWSSVIFVDLKNNLLFDIHSPILPRN